MILKFAIDITRHGDRNFIVDLPNHPYPGSPIHSQLTPKGHDQAFKLGQKLRHEYIHHHKLLPEKYKPGLVYARSTNFERTKSTAKSLLKGLYPESNIEVDVIDHQHDKLLLPIHNPEMIMNGMFVSRFWPELREEIKDKLIYWSEISGIGLLLDSPYDHLHEMQGIIGFADHFIIRKNNGVEFPNGIDDHHAEEIIALNRKLMLHTINTQEQILPDYGQHLFLEITNYFKKVLNQKDDIRYVIFSAHDSTLLTIMSALDVPLDHVPDYVSRINFSLYESKVDNKFFVIITYNDKEKIRWALEKWEQFVG